MMRALRRGGRRSAGVTFIELMIVVAVTAVMVMLVLPTARTFGRRIKEKQLRRGLSQIRQAIDAYHRDWEHGCITSKDPKGWPANLEELTKPIDFGGNLDCPTQNSGPPAPPPPTVPDGIGPQQNAGQMPQGPGRPSSAGKKDRETNVPVPKIYLSRLPLDPFAAEGDEGDVSGWRARSYDDDADSDSWNGKDVYDVRSSSDRLALDGLSRHEDW